MQHQHSSHKFQIKALDSSGEGSFEGVLAVYGNVDLGGDSIAPGALTRSINAKGGRFPLLWQHKTDEPIGHLDVTDSPRGLLVRGQLLLDVPQAKIAYSLIKAKVISGMSIGYDTIKSVVEDGVRQLTELKLWEGSIVTFPMNPMATISAVKSLSADDQAQHLKAIDRHRRAIDSHQRQMREHLKAMVADFEDENDTEDTTIDEEEELRQEQMSKMFLVEMRKLVEEARELA
jgi:HK97 family phage prohead protease